MKKKKKKNNRDVPLCVMPCVTCWGMLHATMSCPGRAAACPVAVGVARCWRHHGVEGGLQTERKGGEKRKKKSKCNVLLAARACACALLCYEGGDWEVGPVHRTCQQRKKVQLTTEPKEWQVEEWGGGVWSVRW